MQHPRLLAYPQAPLIPSRGMEDEETMGRVAALSPKIGSDGPKVVSIDSTDDWQERLAVYGKPPRPLPNLDNCLTALEHSPDWHDVLAYDRFTHQVRIGRRATPWGKHDAEWTDGDDSLLCRWLQRQDINIKTQVAKEAVETHASTNSYDSLVDYLNGLSWDNTPRVDTWLKDYFGVAFNDYSCAVGRAWLISAVKRAYEPGCQADYCIVFEGPEGIKKSTAIKCLAGAELFTDQVPKDYGKEAPIALQGKWIVEFSDLEGLENKQNKVEAVKSFLSRTTDRYRPVHKGRARDFHRRTVWSATTNRDIYLPGETGNRRFWPVKCTYAAADDLARDRDQLWAEAVLLYQMGESSYLDKDTERLARGEQRKRYEEDPWQEEIQRYLAKHPDVSVAELLSKAFKKEVAAITQQDQTRVARCLKALGWEGYRTPGSNSQKRYRQPQ